MGNNIRVRNERGDVKEQHPPRDAVEGRFRKEGDMSSVFPFDMSGIVEERVFLEKRDVGMLSKRFNFPPVLLSCGGKFS